MTADEARAVVCRALWAIVAGDIGAIDLFTEDVVGDSPNMRIRSRSELECQLVDREGALSNIELTIDGFESIGALAVATWSMSADHTGEVLFNEDELFEASGLRIRMSATTTAHFRGRRICAFRTDCDDGDLYDQIRLGRSPEG